MSPEQAAELEGISLERGQRRLAEMGMLNGAETKAPAEPTAGDVKRTRKRRSDAGIARPRPEVSEVKRTEFEWRVEELMQAERALVMAQIRKDRAWVDYCAFVDKTLDEHMARGKR